MREASTVTLAAKEARGAINIALSPETAARPKR